MTKEYTPTTIWKIGNMHVFKQTDGKFVVSYKKGKEFYYTEFVYEDHNDAKHKARELYMEGHLYV